MGFIGNKYTNSNRKTSGDRNTSSTEDYKLPVIHDLITGY